MTKWIKLVFLLILIIIAWIAWQLLTPASLAKDVKTFVIEQGQGVNQISVNLHEAGLIKNKLIFETYIWLQRAEGNIMAGRYELSTNLTIPQLAKVLMGGSAVEEPRLTFLEGWNRQDYATYLDKQGFSGEEFLRLTASPAQWSKDFSFLKSISSTGTLEGFLFPDTYNINEYTTEETLIRRMLKNFETRLDDSVLANSDLFKIITLASIVENEVSDDAQRKIVAGIFINRLEADIGLQSDATVNFITGKSDRRPTLEDLEIDSPYNTYKYRGLPPGPIDNPSLSAIEAAANPASHDYLYFLHNQAGEIFYARTLEEHKLNRELYLD